ncbi:hypothetical protein [Limosilactobacillus reuteri]|uniref:hypothetical protein n=1 Tax=Limosilactobacillus reuteri TaxID=1598 RepID=UPI001380830B|nr:hypothetical protein [Limosilactobacillus reuteri]ECQ5639111.1 hypothetical protein [Campylobacter jejuni]UXE90444.1 hypothetical protein N4560_11895 [Limosilactobacillus reuteri]
MIFNENLNNINLESLLAGIKNYSVMTDQIADNLHDLQKVAQHNPGIADKVNQAESDVRQASITLEKLLEQYSD